MSAFAPALPRSTRPRRRPRTVSATILLVAGAGTIATSFGALGGPLLVTAATAWATLTLVAMSAQGVLPLTIVSACVKAITLVLIIVVAFHPHGAVGPTAWFDWVPLGAANAGSGLWFLALVRKRAA